MKKLTLSLSLFLLLALACPCALADESAAVDKPAELKEAPDNTAKMDAARASTNNSNAQPESDPEIVRRAEIITVTESVKIFGTESYLPKGMRLCRGVIEDLASGAFFKGSSLGHLYLRRQLEDFRTGKRDSFNGYDLNPSYLIKEKIPVP